MGSQGGDGGKREGRRRSSTRLRTLEGGFKVDPKRPNSKELDGGWDTIEDQLTPTSLAKELTDLIEEAQREEKRVVVESAAPERESTPLRVDLSDFGNVALPSYARDADAIATRMHDRFDAGDFQGAYEAATLLLAQKPDDADALRISERAKIVLFDMYAACLGPLTGVPYLAISMNDVLGLGLDHRAGFVLSQVDGMSSFDEILDVTGMTRLDSMRILCDLLISKVIALR